MNETKKSELATQYYEDIQRRCNEYADKAAGEIKERVARVMETVGMTLAGDSIGNDTVGPGLTSSCIIAAVMRDMEHDMLGSLDTKGTNGQLRRQNRELKRLIDTIYATL